MSQQVLDELAEMAKGMEAPDLHPADEDRMIAEALRRHRPQRYRRTTVSWTLAAAAVALLATGAGVGWWLGGDESATGPQAHFRAHFPTGDALVATPTAMFDVQEMTETDRRVAVTRGAVLFDVAPLGEDGAFEVVTPDAVVRVRGTVFSVELGESDSETGTRQTIVRVYEGRVDVERKADGSPETGTNRHRSSVHAGQMWNADQTSPLVAGPLEVDGQAAAARRQRPAVAEASPAEAIAGSSEAIDAPGDVQAPAARSPSGEETLTDSLEATSPAGTDSTSGQGTMDEARPVSTTGPETVGLRHNPQRIIRPATDEPTREEVARWLVEGRYRDVRRVARSRGWRLLEADALAAAGQYAEAADSYDAVAEPHARYSAASIRFHRLNDPQRALNSLDAIPAGSRLGERVLALRARLLVRLHREAEAMEVAQTYLRQHPSGGLADWMRNLVRGSEI